MGERLRMMREQKGISLEELADTLDIPVECMQEVEEGKRSLSKATWQEVACILGVDIAEFYRGNKASFPKVAEKLRSLREAKGLSLNELAKKAGISPSHLSEIERDRAKASLKTLEKLAQALDVPVFSILRDYEEDTLGARLRRLREKMGLSQKELALRTGLSPSLIGQIETGRSQPSLATLHLLADVLGVSTCYFVMEDPPTTLESVLAENQNLLARPALQAVLELLSSWSEPELEALANFLKIVKPRNDVEEEDDELSLVVSFIRTSSPSQRRLLLDLVRALKEKT